MNRREVQRSSKEENLQNALDFLSFYPNVDGRSCSMKKSKVLKLDILRGLLDFDFSWESVIEMIHLEQIWEDN